MKVDVEAHRLDGGPFGGNSLTQMLFLLLAMYGVYPGCASIRQMLLGDAESFGLRGGNLTKDTEDLDSVEDGYHFLGMLTNAMRLFTSPVTQTAMDLFRIIGDTVGKK